MTSYIALLRGINVGGHNVKMDRLRALFEEAGLDRVRTYIASGNVFFDTDEGDAAAITQRLEQQLADVLGFGVPVFLRTPEEIENALNAAPFPSTGPQDDERFCITFTQTPITPDLVLPAASASGDMEILAAREREAYVVWRILKGRPPASNFAERTLPSPATTRFFHTTHKILEAARKA